MEDVSHDSSLGCILRTICTTWIKCVMLSIAFLEVSCNPTALPQSLIYSYDNSTPFPGAIKCYTCSDKMSNDDCNRKAYDAFCPSGTKYCHTAHHLHPQTNASIVVTKQCARQGMCSPQTVGCFEKSPEQKICISCCEGSKCNYGIPVNETTAILTTITPYNSSPIKTHTNVILMWILMTVAYVFRIAA